jgi:hypothetical protein
MQLLRIIWILGLFCCNSVIYSQTSSDSFPLLRGLIAGVGYGSIFAHSTAVQNTKGSHPRGIELQIMNQRVDRKTYNICRCYPRQSILTGAYSFDNKVLGWSGMAAYMLEPSYRISDRFFFSMRGSAGLAYASEPYDANKNPTNQSYSTTINAYLLYGLGLQFQFNQRMAMQLTANFQHISNGGLREPNKGVNWPTVGLHLVRYQKPFELYRGSRQKDESWRSSAWRKEVAVFGIAKRWIDENGESKRLPVGGVMAQIGKQVGVINQVNAGIEWSYDDTTEKRLKADSIAGSPHKLGLMGGHEFLLGKYIFSQQIGIYIFKDSPYNRSWFHRWGLLYKAGNNFWLGFNLKAHLHVADFIDLRLVYSWH